jgi:excisionase family DNA binding protein
MNVLEQLEARSGMMTAEEVAALTGLCVKTIYRQIRQRKLKAASFGSSFRLNPSDVADWVRSRTK